MQRLRLSQILVASLFAEISLSVPDRAQTLSVLDGLASQTAATVVQSHAERVLTVILPSCSQAAQICTEFDGHLHTKLEQVIPGVQFVAQNDSVRADVLVNEGLLVLFGDFELSSVIVQTAQGKTLDEFKAKVASYPSCVSCPDPDWPPGQRENRRRREPSCNDYSSGADGQYHACEKFGQGFRPVSGEISARLALQTGG